MKQKDSIGSRRQQGIALPIIMIILVLAALVTIYTTTTSVKEQQVTADQYRSEQAFSTAQAGVDVALERHNHFEIFTVDGCGNAVQPETDITSNCTDFSGSEKGSFKVMFCDIWDDGDETANDDDDEDGITGASLMKDFLTDIYSCTNPINIADADEPDGFKNDERVGILSVGKPDDNSGRRTISVVSTPGFKVGDAPPGPPFTARGSVGLTGNLTLINRYTNLTLWLGEYLNFTSAATKTFIHDGSLDRDDSIYPDGDVGDSAYRLDMMSPDTTKSVVAASNDKIGQNADALTGDANLTNITADDMFESIFCSSKSDVKAMAKEAGLYYTSIDEIDEYQTGLIWLELSESDTLNKYIGTFESSVFLIVEFPDPDTDVFTIQGGNTTTDLTKMHFGQFFIFGNADLQGSTVIIGSLILAERAAKVSGGGTVVYDPESLKTSPEGPAGLRGIKPGTWKDWGYVN